MATDDERATALLNELKVSTDLDVKKRNLREVSELVLHKNPSLLPRYFEHILELQLEHSADIKKAVVLFLKEVCLMDSSYLHPTWETLGALLDDESALVVKDSIATAVALVRPSIHYISTASNPSGALGTWKEISAFLGEVVGLLDKHQNQGVLSTAFKGLETMAIAFAEAEPLRPDHPVLPNQPDLFRQQALRCMEALVERVAFLKSYVSAGVVLASLGVLAVHRSGIFTERIVGVLLQIKDQPPPVPPQQRPSVLSALKQSVKAILNGAVGLDLPRAATPPAWVGAGGGLGASAASAPVVLSLSQKIQQCG
ncbi:hypothetical protein PAPYR_6887 [Paratrimastix pyriformis]|uniref:Uncharacterized protein n=1 Tax=Paratrimastix pyriformis TaxID=342808 RepID=A0ABQ8UEG0_9EUKA|nr:hypothetical protein PAPYR_6887 [Paratrimastix pyriformis]